MTKRLSVVAYAVNGAGLGHLTRVIAILRWVRRLGRLAGFHPDIYILTSSEASGLALTEGFAAFKIPSKTAIRQAQILKEDYIRLARQWVWHSLGLIRPDIFLVDTFPGGSFGELIYALDGPGSKVFINRAMKAEFQESIQPLLVNYDRILVPQEIDSPKIEFPPQIASKVSYLGPIMLRDRVELRSKTEARKRLGVPDNKLGVWITAGGGGDPTAEIGLKSLVSQLEKIDELHLIVGAGPLYRGEPLRSPKITWLTDFNVSEDYLAADFAFSAAGYNSFHELLHAGIPTAFFAQEKIADEQARRLETAIKANCALKLEVDAQSIPINKSLQETLSKLLDSNQRQTLSDAAKQFISQNWAQEAAFETLLTKIPKAPLVQAQEIATPELFHKISQYNLDLELAYEVLPTLGSAEFLDGDERQDLFYQLFEESEVSAELTAKFYLLLSQKLAKPTNDFEAEALVEASLAIINQIGKFNDERGAMSFLKLLPSERQTEPKKIAKELGEFLSKLHQTGDSLWRGIALYNQD
jgi:predicted glycosyltransferase